MKSFEIAARLFGRRFQIFTVTVKEEAMKTETPLFRIRITDASGIGYVAGHTYSVTANEALKLCQAGKAVAIDELPAYQPEVETATLKMPKAEKRAGKK